MPVLSAKRQITLPKDLCDRLDVAPGAVLDIVEHGGKITILKQIKGSSRGVLRHLKADPRYPDDESRDSAIDTRVETRGDDATAVSG